MRAARLAAAMLTAVGVLGASAAAAGASEVIYNNIPSSLPGNFLSLGNEAYSMSEIGGEIEFAGTARKNLNVTAVMSSWACQRGNWAEETCESGLRKIKKFFVVPVTFSLYAAGPEGAVGAKLWSRTKRFKMQYRPSDSPSCTGGRWYDEATATCYHGKAFAIKLTGMKVRNLPSRVIVSVSYNTSTHGPRPIGEAACRSTSQGCPYDSLNVALSEPAEGTLSVGADPTEDVYVNSTYAPMFCSSGTEGVFGPASCPAFFEGEQPLLKIGAN